MIRRALRNIQRSLVIPVALIALTGLLSQTAQASVSDGDRSRLAIFALGADQPEQAIRWLSGVETDHGSLLRARAWLVTGRRDQARAALEKVATKGKTHRGDASLELARLAVSEGRTEDAASWLRQAVNQAQGDSRQKAMFLQAELSRGAERFDQAGKILSRMEPGYWAALGYLNLAVDYGRIDRDPSRALISLRVAHAMAASDTDARRMDDLSLRILVKAGVLSYRRGDHDKALDFLNKVSLDSYLAPQALYFHGLAHAANDNYRAAMQSWHRARKFPLAFPGAADAWLGMGRGYDEAGYLGHAGEAYLAAISAFESEKVSIQTLRQEIQKKGAFEAMVKAARRNDVEWFLADSRTLTQPRVAYLLHFMEQAGAQEAVNRIAGLESMDIMLKTRDRDLEIFIAALTERLRSGNNGSAEALKPGLEGLADRWKILSGNAAPGSAEARELQSIRLTLTEISRGTGSFDRRRAETADRLAGLAERARVGRQDVQAALRRVSGLRERAEQALDDLALEFLDVQREQIAHALDRTEQQIAHLYEHLALTGLEREDSRD
ncbi:tetratricopeptide repeat protein [Marinobacter sp.]|uniref:tetratricopeptide repeat protein n=1 Tax=Marinobacter sp. TaxID=50741 RepID=UPI00384AA07D